MRPFQRPAIGVVVTLGATTVLTAALAPFKDDVGLLNVGFLFLLLTLLIASIWGGWIGLLAAFVTNLAFNFFFIDPLYKFTVQEPRNVVALVVFLIVSIIGGLLLSASRRAADVARRRQAETEVALRLSRAMGGQTQPDEALQALCSEVTRAFAAPGAAVLTREADAWGVLAHAGEDESRRPPTPEERAAAERAATEGSFQGLGWTGLDRSRRRRVIIPTGRGSAFRRDRPVAMVPLRLGNRTLGVLRLDGPIGDSPFRDNPEPLLNAVASEAALAVQRAELAKDAAHAAALEEADELKTALMASISHDLKTPLAGIKAAISSLLDKRVSWSEEDIAAFHATIDSQADRLNRVISDILDLNRIESGSLSPEQSPVGVRQLLDRARQITSFETKGREITLDAAPDLRIETDESLVTQALVNLIENAAKYSRPGSSIHLLAEADGSDVVISVKDEGPGIAEQDLPFVFERFYRAEEHSRRVKGSGLGLTIVKGFVELVGGSVSVESSPKGTRFVIRVPVAAPLKASA